MKAASDRLLANLVAIGTSGRASRRAIAATFKICGRKLERRWPFLSTADADNLDLGISDLLEFQFARSRDFTALIIGAYDGVANDPASQFVRERQCRAIFVEPQRGPFGRLCESMRGQPRVDVVNAAIDCRSGSRVLYCVPSGIEGLPDWAEQLGSFDREHLLRHEARAPGLSRQIVEVTVPTISFDDLIARFGLTRLDLLQIDVEGFDAQLIEWFPFEDIMPALIYYETVHLRGRERDVTTMRLVELGYKIFPSESGMDDMAILF